MKILLFGANGQVGHELLPRLRTLGDVVATTRSGRLDDGTACETADFDAPDALPALIERIAPALVVNAAAYTAVDRAESEVEAAYRANAEAPGAIARACAARDALLVHYSTDYVFDGAGARPWREDDATAPLGVYGASKLAGEEAIRAAGGRHAIFRTAWVYASHGKNFLRTMLRLAAERDELRVVADQIGSPTPARLIAERTVDAIREGRLPHHGLWHLTSSGQTSWHGFTEAIVVRAHARGLIAKRPAIVPITTADYPTPARRPAYSVLDGSRLGRELGGPTPDWRDGLDRVLDELG